jgi:hypothetical protein
MRPLIVAVFVAACLTPALVAAQEPDQACTLIGCSSGVGVNVKSVAQVAGAKRVTVCVNDKCRRFSTTTSVARVNAPGLSGDERATVKVVVRGSGDRVLLRVVRRVALRRLQPNGPGCPPVCWNRSLKLDVAGRRLVVLD